MITAAAVESAYSFFHQKARVYAGSHIPSQRDDIEYAISNYASAMDRGLYSLISNGAQGFLHEHSHFAHDMQQAVDKLETML